MNTPLDLVQFVLSLNSEASYRIANADGTPDDFDAETMSPDWYANSVNQLEDLRASAAAWILARPALATLYPPDEMRKLIDDVRNIGYEALDARTREQCHALQLRALELVDTFADLMEDAVSVVKSTNSNTNSNGNGQSTAPIDVAKIILPLTAKMETLLLKMLESNAIGSRLKTTKDKLIKSIGPNHEVGQYREAFTRLRTEKYTDSLPGPAGGIWLTGKGKKAAERLKNNG